MKVKRLAVYYLHNDVGVIDESAFKYIEELKKFADCLLLLLGGNMRGDVERLLNYSDYICEIPLKVKSTAFAYKYGLEFLSWFRIFMYDELLLTSSRCMGPVGSFDFMFNTMGTKKADFWGVTKQYFEERIEGKEPKVYEYIPLDFCCYSKSTFPIIKAFFDKKLRIYQEDRIIDYNAVYLADDLKKSSCVCAEYVDTTLYKGVYSNPLLFSPLELVRDQKCPVFYEDIFIGEYKYVLENNSGLSGRRFLDYIELTQCYDSNILWSHILKCGFQEDIYNNLNLNYLLSSSRAEKKQVEDVLERAKIALVMHLYFMDLLELSLHYAESMPSCSDVYITTNTQEKKAMIEKKFSSLKCNKIEVRLVENRGRDVSAYLIGVRDVIMDYDYACFMHDKKSAQVLPGSVGIHFGYKCQDNILGSKELVENIILTLHDNPHMGMLSPLYPYHGIYYPTHGVYDWGINYVMAERLCDDLGIKIPIREDKSPIAPIGTMFWVKPKALALLFNKKWKYEDFPPEPNQNDGTLLHAFERIYSIVVQEEGFFPAIVGSKEYASAEIAGLRFYLKSLNQKISGYTQFNNFEHVSIIIDEMLHKSKSYDYLRESSFELEARNKELNRENKELREERDALIPKSSLKWQLRDRIKHIWKKR